MRNASSESTGLCFFATTNHFRNPSEPTLSEIRDNLSHSGHRWLRGAYRSRRLWGERFVGFSDIPSRRALLRIAAGGRRSFKLSTPVGVYLLIAGTGARCRRPCGSRVWPLRYPAQVPYTRARITRRGTERLPVARETLSYSRLTAADEEGTDYRRAARIEAFSPSVARRKTEMRSHHQWREERQRLRTRTGCSANITMGGSSGSSQSSMSSVLTVTLLKSPQAQSVRKKSNCHRERRSMNKEAQLATMLVIGLALALNWCSNHWCAAASSRASAARTAVMSLRANAVA
jgi:hypothetical protein